MAIFSRFIKRTRGSSPATTIQLLSRPGCHLCDDARDALKATLRNVTIDEVDITQHRDLEDEYVFRIPVVLHRGEVLAEGVIGRAEARSVRKALFGSSLPRRGFH